MATDRKAEVTWRGDLMSGAGTIRSVTSGAFAPLDVSWASRAEEPAGKTSPEELIAAAHAACYSMALSAGLARGGTPPETLETSATVTFVPGTGITKSALTVGGPCRASTPTASSRRPRRRKTAARCRGRSWGTSSSASTRASQADRPGP